MKLFSRVLALTLTLIGSLQPAPELSVFQKLAQKHAPVNHDAIKQPFFKTFPHLAHKVGYVKLANLPTPIKHLKTLGAMLGTTSLYMKMDNLTDGGVGFGGNKIRKLEFLLGDAVRNEARDVLTIGDAGSNHVAATAVACKKLGIACTALHIPQIPTWYARRNQAIAFNAGANMILFGTDGQRTKALHQMNRALKEASDHYYYYIPGGGSNELGALGFVNAALELKEQITAGLMPEPDVIFLPAASAATAAGLIIGAKLARLKTVVIPVGIQPEAYPGSKTEILTNMVRLTNDLLNKLDPTIPLLDVTADETVVHQGFDGPAYAAITPEAFAAIALLEKVEGVKLDGTYAGKACAYMIDALKAPDMKKKVVLYWNTFYASDDKRFVENFDYTQLPKEYHHYFTAPLQLLDQGF